MSSFEHYYWKDIDFSIELLWYPSSKPFAVANASLFSCLNHYPVSSTRPGHVYGGLNVTLMPGGWLSSLSVFSSCAASHFFLTYLGRSHMCTPQKSLGDCSVLRHIQAPATSPCLSSLDDRRAPPSPFVRPPDCLRQESLQRVLTVSSMTCH